MFECQSTLSLVLNEGKNQELKLLRYLYSNNSSRSTCTELWYLQKRTKPGKTGPRPIKLLVQYCGYWIDMVNEMKMV